MTRWEIHLFTALDEKIDTPKMVSYNICQEMEYVRFYSNHSLTMKKLGRRHGGNSDVDEEFFYTTKHSENETLKATNFKVCQK